MANQGEKWNYETIGQHEGVKMKLPKEFEVAGASSFETAAGDIVVVLKHYRYGMMVPRDGKGQGCRFLNIHYYGFTAVDFGASHIADIELVRKFRGEQEYLLINVRKQVGIRKHLADIAYRADINEGVLIPGTKTRIVVTQRKSRELDLGGHKPARDDSSVDAMSSVVCA